MTATETANRLLKALRSWKYVLKERYLRLFAPHESPYPPSWPLPPADELKNLVVRWPASRIGGELHQWLFPILTGLRRHVRVEIVPIEQPKMSANFLELVRGGKSYTLAIDTHDFMDRLDQGALDQAVVYFKMQFHKDGYGNDRIVPGGYVNLSEHYCHYLGWLRGTKDRQLAEYDVYGRFSLDFAPEVRKRAVQMLWDQKQFHFEGSLQTVRYTRSLEEAARSRLCIDLPGNGDFCFRLIDYLGIGACVVAARHRTILPMPLEDRKHLVYAKEDLSDFVELCQYYLEHEDERNQIVQNSREYWDRYLHPTQLGAYYLHTALKIIDAS